MKGTATTTEKKDEIKNCHGIEHNEKEKESE
jgi:hypothetical protein